MSENIDLTDEQILNSLIIKRDRLIHSLSKTNIAIEAFEDGGDKASTNRPQESIGSVEIANNYDIEAPYSQKVMYILKQTAGATVDEIVEYIGNREQVLNREKLKARITQTASKLYGGKKINALKVIGEKKYKYLLK